jgi:hypothetical protein
MGIIPLQNPMKKDAAAYHTCFPSVGAPMLPERFRPLWLPHRSAVGSATVIPLAAREFTLGGIDNVADLMTSATVTTFGRGPISTL